MSKYKSVTKIVDSDNESKNQLYSDIVNMISLDNDPRKNIDMDQVAYLSKATPDSLVDMALSYASVNLDDGFFKQTLMDRLSHLKEKVKDENPEQMIKVSGRMEDQGLRIFEENNNPVNNQLSEILLKSSAAMLHKIQTRRIADGLPLPFFDPYGELVSDPDMVQDVAQTRGIDWQEARDDLYRFDLLSKDFIEASLTSDDFDINNKSKFEKVYDFQLEDAVKDENDLNFFMIFNSNDEDEPGFAVDPLEILRSSGPQKASMVFDAIHLDGENKNLNLLKCNLAEIAVNSLPFESSYRLKFGRSLELARMNVVGVIPMSENISNPITNIIEEFTNKSNNGSLSESEKVVFETAKVVGMSMGIYDVEKDSRGGVISSITDKTLYVAMNSKNNRNIDGNEVNRTAVTEDLAITMQSFLTNDIIKSSVKKDVNFALKRGDNSTAIKASLEDGDFANQSNLAKTLKTALVSKIEQREKEDLKKKLKTNCR